MTMDLHGNLTQKMIDNTTATVLYRSNPHLDASLRALECAEIIVRTIKGEVRPAQALEMPPMVINIVKQFTGEEPMRSFIQDANEVIGRPGMLSASVAEGYPYADVEQMGMGFLAISDGTRSPRAMEPAGWPSAHGRGVKSWSPTCRRPRKLSGPPPPKTVAPWC